MLRVVSSYPVRILTVVTRSPPRSHSSSNTSSDFVSYVLYVQVQYVMECATGTHSSSWADTRWQIAESRMSTSVLQCYSSMWNTSTHVSTPTTVLAAVLSFSHACVTQQRIASCMRPPELLFTSRYNNRIHDGVLHRIPAHHGDYYERETETTFTIRHFAVKEMQEFLSARQHTSSWLLGSRHWWIRLDRKLFVHNSPRRQHEPYGEEAPRAEISNQVYLKANVVGVDISEHIICILKKLPHHFILLVNVCNLADADVASIIFSRNRGLIWRAWPQ